MKKVLFFFLSVFLFSGSLLAQNPTNGGTIAVNGGNTQSICVGEIPSTIVSTAPATGGNTSLPIEYMWMSTQTPGAIPGGVNYTAIPNSNSENYSPGPLSATTFFVRCARRVGSGNLNFTAETNVVTILVNSNPTAIITPSTINAYVGQTIDFSAAFDAVGSLYAWDLNGNGFNNAFGQNVSWTYNSAGTVTVTLTVTNSASGCTNIATVNINVLSQTGASISDPCSCDNPFNINDFPNLIQYSHDYILINSGPGETWTITNIAGFGGGIFNANALATPIATPIPVGTTIPETGSGTYYTNLWFNGQLGGWQVTVQNNNGVSLTAGPGATTNCTICPGSPLPVELSYFNASVDGERVLLTWETAAELDNSHFEIERSIDGSRFESLGAVEGAGSTNQATTYKFEDKNPIAGETYYRLKQVDVNGEFEYSNIEIVKIATDATIISVSPNPITKNAIVRLGDNLAPNTTLELLSPAGQVVRTFTVIEGSNSLEIDLGNLAEGIYFLNVENASREQKAFYKVIKL